MDINSILNIIKNFYKPVFISIVSLLIGILIRITILNKTLKKISQKAPYFTRSLKDFIVVLFFISGILFSTWILPLKPSTLKVIYKFISSVIIFFLSFIFAKFLNFLIRKQNEKFQDSFVTTSLFGNIVKVTILFIGTAIILQNLGISITPILTALGVGGIAVALALQDTLSNLFAGIFITVARNLKIGDYVKLEDNIEGFIHDINWRTTIIKDYGNNFYIIPNNKISSSIIKNFSFKDNAVRLYISLSVSYDSNLEKVEKVTYEVAKKIIENNPLYLKDDNPIIRFKEFEDSGIKLTVIFKVKNYDSTFFIKHQFIKAIHKKYSEENIVIPYPQITVHFNKNLNK